MKENRRLVLADEKEQIIDLSAQALPVPTQTIYEGELRYYAASVQYQKVIEGIVSWLTDVAAWSNATDESYAAIQQISIFLEGIELTILNCSDVENCLTTSEIIETITSNVAASQAAIAALQSNSGVANQFPQASSYTDDDVCKAQDGIAQSMIDNLSDIFTQKNESDFGTWLNDAISHGGYIADGLDLLWSTVDGGYIDTIADLTASSPQFRAGLEPLLTRIEAKEAIIADTSLSTYVKDMAASLLDAITDGLFNQWAFVGKSTSTASCALTKTWDFSTGQQGWVGQGDNRATYDGTGWVLKNMGYAWTLVIEKSFTWPDDLVLTAMRVYMENPYYAQFNAFYGMPYANDARGVTVASFGYQSLVSMSKGTKTGLGYEYSVPSALVGQKITMIQVDYTGTESSNW